MTISGSFVDARDDDFFSAMPPLSEAGCILQDYIGAWLLYNGDLQRRHSYDECLFEVVKERAIFVQENIQ